MRTKNDTVETHFHPVLTEFLFTIDLLYLSWNGELVITSGSELTSKHSYTSLHYATPCQAADIRIWETGDTPKPEKQLTTIVAKAYTFCMDHNIPFSWIEVILEAYHIHIEYQPKRPQELD